MNLLTERGSPRFLVVGCVAEQRPGCMIAQRKSHSECQKKQTQPEVPSVDLQLADVQSAKYGYPCYVTLRTMLRISYDAFENYN